MNEYNIHSLKKVTQARGMVVHAHTVIQVNLIYVDTFRTY
jgi:hypothetical protein